MKFSIRKIMALLLVLAMVFTTSGVATFAESFEETTAFDVNEVLENEDLENEVLENEDEIIQYDETENIDDNEETEEESQEETTEDFSFVSEEDITENETVVEESFEEVEEENSLVETTVEEEVVEETSEVDAAVEETVEETIVEETIEETETSVEETTEEETLALEQNLVNEELLNATSHGSDFEQKASSYFSGTKTLSKSAYLSQDTTFSSGTISVTSDKTICLHEKNLTLSGGVFSVAAGATLTISNCGSAGTLTLSGAKFATGAGKVVISELKVKTNGMLNFNGSKVDFDKATFTSISTSGNYFVNAINSSVVNFNEMSFDGLQKGFYYDNSEGNIINVSVRNSTVNDLFTVKNQSRILIKPEGYYKYSYFENNKNIATVDNSVFMVSGGLNLTDTGADIFTTNILTGEPVRKVTSLNVKQSDIKLYDTPENPINEDRLLRVVFRNNKGNYLFGAKNNSEIYFSGIAVHNSFTENSNGKMGAYVNLGGKNKLVLRGNPYINQNTRNIVVTDNDNITSNTNEIEYCSAAKPLGLYSTLSFYITEHKYRILLKHLNDAEMSQSQDNKFFNKLYNVTLNDGTKIEEYFNPVCMIEGHRDDLFVQYGEDYPGTNMRTVFGQGQDGSGDFGYFAEPFVEKDEITIKLNANGGEFKDPNGNNVTTSYSFVFDKNHPDESLRNWFSSLVPTYTDPTDNYEGEFRGWSRVEDGKKMFTVDEILSYESDIELYAYFNIPKQYKFVFRAEKNGASNLKGIAYNDFPDKIVYVRMTESNGVTGDIAVPKVDIELINGFKLKEDINYGKRWKAEDESNAPELFLYEDRQYSMYNRSQTTFYYYLEYQEPEVDIKINANGGTFYNIDGSPVLDSYSFNYKKYSSSQALTNWLRNLKSTKVEEIDEYEVISNTFVDVNDSSKTYTAEDLMELTGSVEVKFVYVVPTLYTYNFTAEKNNATSLKTKAYNSFDKVTKYVRLDKDNNTKGIVNTPALPEAINGYKSSLTWVDDNNNTLQGNANVTVNKTSAADTTFNYYLTWTESSINVVINANGGEFVDPDGNKVTNKYSFSYQKFSTNEKVATWFKALTAKAVDATDGYEVAAKGFATSSTGTDFVNLSNILDNLEDVELYAIYEFPTLYTYNFTAEKNNATSLKTKAYNNFDKVTKYVRLDKENNTKGSFKTPALPQVINGFKSSTTWVDDNKNTLQGNADITVTKKSAEANTFNFYLTWTEPSINVVVNANGGEFTDPDGNKVTDKYSFTYKKFSTDTKVANWFKALTAKAVDTNDNYEVNAKGFATSATGKDYVNLANVLEGLEDVELYAIYDFPKLYKVYFRAEEGNNTKLKGKAYDSFTEKVIYVRQDKDNNTTGRITAPAIDVEVKSGYTLNDSWVTENAKNNKTLKPNVETVFNPEDANEIYYYLDFVEPEITIIVNANGGEFTDPDGNKVTDKYSFNYTRFTPNQELSDWLTNLTAKKVDTRDNYEVTTNKWTKVSANGEEVIVDEVLNYNTGIEIFAKYEFPTLYTYNFTAEKDNATNWKTKAYNNFDKVTTLVRLDKENNTKGSLKTPALPQAINNFKSSTTWVDDKNSTLQGNADLTVTKTSAEDTTFNYYLTWTEPSINVVVNANGGEFTDPDGNKVTDKYSFTYKKFSTDAKVANWFKALTAKAVDKTDNYEVNAKGFATSATGKDFVNLANVLEGSSDVNIYAIYEFPTLYTYNFTAEKNNATTLKTKAYNNFDKVTKFVRLDKDNNTKGSLKTPALPQAINDFKSSTTWVDDNNNTLQGNADVTISKNSGSVSTFNYYLTWTEPSINVVVNANGGEFTDPNGNKVTDKYSFTYKKFSTDAKVANWFKALTAKAVDKTDNYEVTAKGFATSSNGKDFVNLANVLEALENVELYAIYEFPTLYTYNFTAEKNNATTWKTKAYNNFDKVTKYVRFDKENNTKGILKTPALPQAINDFKSSTTWVDDNNNTLQAGADVTISKNSGSASTFNYYMTWTEPSINITVNANGGEFTDPNGNKVTDKYSFTYKKFSTDEKITNWFKNLQATKVDTVDNYKVTTKGFATTPISTVYVDRTTVLNGNLNQTLYAIYNEFPTLYKAVFRAEKGGATDLQGKAYYSFEPITINFRLDKNNNTEGQFTAPTTSSIKLINDYTTDSIWRAEDSKYSNVNAGKTLTVKKISGIDNTLYFYLNFTAKANDTPSGGSGNNSGGGSSSGGSSSGGSSSGGSSSGSSSSDSSSIGPAAPTSPTSPTDPLTPAQQEVQQQQTEVQVQAPAEVPTNENPFGIETVMNAVGQVEVLSAEETGKAQMEKANAVIQEALANTNREVAKVSEVSVKAEEAQWTQSADGKWSLSTNNAEPIKDTWQKVEGANGKEGWYKFDKEGKMQTGWVADGDHVFYLIESGENAGQMVRGTTINIGGVEFKFTAEGALESMQDKSALVGNTVTSNLANTNTQTTNDALVNAAATDLALSTNAANNALLNAAAVPDAAAIAAANNAAAAALANNAAATLATGQTVEQIRAAYELAQAQFEANLAALAMSFNNTAAAVPAAPVPATQMAAAQMAAAVPTANAYSAGVPKVIVVGVNDFESGNPIIPILP